MTGMAQGLLQSIEATPQQIIFHGAGVLAGVELGVHEIQPFELATRDPETLPAPILQTTPVVDGGGFRLAIDRFTGGRDRLYSAFRLSANGAPLAGVQYVTNLNGIAHYDFPYPQANSIKGLQVRLEMVEDAVKLGVCHAGINLNQGDIMLPGPGPDVTPFELDGETFYFDEAYLREFDKSIKALSDHGMIVTLILLNSPNWRRPMHPEMKGVLLHPNYNPEGLISAFNVVTPEGYRHYKAFVEFAAARYSRPDQAHGRVTGYIVSNEIDSQWVWGNAGEITVEDYLRQYSVAMRATYYAARKAWGEARVYISLDHLWTISHINDPLRTYPSRRCLELLNERARREGNYDWSVAFHPYPEDLRYPDFWNDQTAPDTIDAPRITFRNIEQLPVFLGQPDFLFDGRQRHIILSEQGMNSMGTEESEAFQAASYALAFRKIAACPSIDSFLLHAHADNLDEFGLNLGLWRIDEKGNPTTPKPAYAVFRDIDGPQGDAIYEKAKEFLGKKMNRRGEEKLF